MPDVVSRVESVLERELCNAGVSTAAGPWPVQRMAILAIAAVRPPDTDDRIDDVVSEVAEALTRRGHHFSDDTSAALVRDAILLTLELA